MCKCISGWVIRKATMALSPWQRRHCACTVRYIQQFLSQVFHSQTVKPGMCMLFAVGPPRNPGFDVFECWKKIHVLSTYLRNSLTRNSTEGGRTHWLLWKIVLRIWLLEKYEEKAKARPRKRFLHLFFVFTDSLLLSQSRARGYRQHIAGSLRS